MTDNDLSDDDDQFIDARRRRWRKNAAAVSLPDYDTLVLSGNSTNAIAVLGGLQRIFDEAEAAAATDSDESPLQLVNFVGTSSGSVISLLIAVGYTPIELVGHMCVDDTYRKLARYNVCNLVLFGGGLVDFDPIERCVETLLVDKIGYVPTLGELRAQHNRRLTCVAYDLTDDRRVYLTPDSRPNLSALSAVRMSCTFPFIFAPYRCDDDGHYYIDGGIADNFAVQYAQSIDAHRRILALYIKAPQTVEPYVVDGNLSLLKRLIEVYVRLTTEDRLERLAARPPCDVIPIELPTSFFNFGVGTIEILEMFDKGYAACKRRTARAALNVVPTV